MSWRFLRPSAIARVQRIALGAYALANRRGWLDSERAGRVFRAAYFLYKRHLEDPYYGLTRRRPDLFEGALVLDVGANLGYTASVFAAACGPEGRVIAFEPDPTNYAKLSGVAKDSSGRIDARQVAVGRAPGPVKLWINHTHHADHRVLTPALASQVGDSAVVPVEQTTIDAVLAELRDPTQRLFVKIDVQGYETEVCEGMRDTVARMVNCAVALEYAPRAMHELGFQPASVLDFFSERGFCCRLLERGESPSSIDRSGLDALLEHREYVDLLFTR